MPNLDMQQKKAVQYLDGPILVCAGPGSGKTRTLVYRIVHLLKKGTLPENIIAVAFTNKAAKEIKDRVIKLVKGRKLKEKGTKEFIPYVGTIHQLCLNILRKETKEAFLIINEYEQRELVKDLKSRYKIKGTIKDLVKTIRDNKTSNKSNSDSKILISKYYKLLESYNAYDFDDILNKTLTLLTNNRSARKKYQKRYKHVLVDEFQDISPLQNEILEILAKPQNNIFAIGDANQSIYGFRGTDTSKFLEFEYNFINAYIIKYTYNYRSTPSIVNSSKDVIVNNKKRIPLKTKSLKDEKNLVKIILCGDEKDEAKYISKQIEKTIGGTMLVDIDKNQSYDKEDTLFSDFCILYRTHSFAPYIEQELMHRGIPYQIIGKNNIWKTDEVQYVLSLIRHLVFKDPLSKIKLNKLNIDTKISKANISNILETAINKIKTHYKSNVDALVNIDKIFQIIKSIDYSSLQDLVAKLSLRSRETFIDDRANCVKLLTIHQAKGLEFENVFISGCEEGFFPHLKNIKSRLNIEEERRLFYVGMTRAKKNLYLTYAKSRQLWGKREVRKPSRFLNEINPKNCNRKNFFRKRRKKDQMKLFK